MITLAGLVDRYLRDFTWQARSTFALLDRLDAMLAALLAADEAGAEGERKRVSMTERVRIKSLVEGTRVTVFDVRDEGEEAGDDEDEDDNDDDEEEADLGAAEACEVGRWAMAAARVYEKSLSRL